MPFQMYQKAISLEKNFLKLLLIINGVALVPGTSFGDSAKMYIRLSYANSLENIEKAINRLSKI